MPPSAAKVGLDTNVLVYAVDADAGEKHETARRLIESLYTSGSVIPLQALGEFYASVSRKRIASLETANEAVRLWITTFEVVPGILDDLHDGAAAIGRYALSFWDAHLCATVRRAGCTVLLTEDMQDGAEIGGVRIMNPFRGRGLPRKIRELLS